MYGEFNFNNHSFLPSDFVNLFYMLFSYLKIIQYLNFYTL
jgi:hypothetical protein